MSYFSLHCHTEYSNLRFLDSTNKLKELINKAIFLNLKGVAITDHEALSGWIKAIQIQKKLQEQGSDFRIFLGDEIYLVDSIEDVRDNYIPKQTKFYHFILIAKDEIGGKQIRQISSQAWENSFYTGKMCRTPIAKHQLKTIIGNEKGHIIAQTACIGSELAYWILQDNSTKCLEFIDWCQNVFLPDNFYLEMQPNDCEEQVRVNQIIIKISEQLNIPYIITTDAHYLSADQRDIHTAYLNSREEDSRETGEFYRTCYLMDADEIHQWMDKQIGAEKVDIALNNTYEIADKIEFFDLNHTQIVPKVPIPEFKMKHSFSEVYDECEYIKKFAYSDDIHDRYFLYLIEQGWLEKEYKEDLSKEEINKMLHRIDVELKAVWLSSENIHDKISNYYITALFIEQKIMWEDAESLVGVSRGSIASFYTAYLIGLQQINSYKQNIPYWRHLHESRPEMPDVDIDSEKSKRQAIIEATRKNFGEDKVLNICAFRTEGAKSAILTSARGLGVSNDEAQYIASLIPSVRGKLTPLSVMVYGDEDNKPNVEFINECKKYDKLIETALSIEGMVCGRTVHASGVIIFENPYYELNCMMKATNGQPTTQWDMDDSTYAGGLKYDYLTINNLDAMHQCMDLLVEYGYIDWQGSLLKTYNKYFHPDVLDYSSEKMWKMAENHEIVNLFQFMTDVGAQAVKKIKPRSLTELGVANAVMRLMSGESGREQPLDKYVKYKNNIQEWYDVMNKYHLTTEEKDIIKKYLEHASGMSTMQEDVMNLSMDKNISNYSMKEANVLRKLIAKKKVALHKQAEENFYKKGLENGTSQNMLDYVWKECVKPQLQYSFSLPHILGYSTIAVQEMNMAYKYPIIYWNCANLIVDSMSDEELDGSTNYGKVGIAINNMIQSGINITPPLINEAKFGFTPDEKNNRIIFALKAMNGIGDDIAQSIIQNRPYISMKDFATRMIDTNIIKNAQMIKLIKGGCFTEIHSHDKRDTMKWYLSKYCINPVSSLTLSQFNKMIEYNIIPDELGLAIRMVNFKKYVLADEGLYEKWIDPNKPKIPKKGYHDGHYILDEPSQEFFKQHFTEESIVDVVGGFYVLSEKKFTKEIDKKIEPLKEWFNSEEAIQTYNQALFNEAWNKYAKGTPEAWSMEALTYYDGDHELKNTPEDTYGIVNFFELPEEPVAYEFYTKYIDGKPKAIPKYNISRIAGTVVQADNNHHSVALLTTHGLVNIKFSKGHYAFYNKTISEIGVDGKKKTIENSWLKRGNKLLVSGYRRGEQFIPWIYNDTIYKHRINLIEHINEDGTLQLKAERAKV